MWNPFGSQSRPNAYGDLVRQDGGQIVRGMHCNVSVVSCKGEQLQRCCSRCNFSAGLGHILRVGICHNFSR